MPDVDTIVGYTPGLIGRIAELHARYYSAHWQFGPFFEAKVATELSTFIQRYNAGKDGIWSLVSTDKRIEGSITIDGSSQNNRVAHLRWFIVSDRLRGQGGGHHLMAKAVSFCRQAGFDKVYLWTFQGLAPARHLYEKFGFRLVQSRSGRQWGTMVTEQRFEWRLKGSG